MGTHWTGYYVMRTLICSFVFFFSKEHLSQCAYKEVQCPNPGCATKLLSQNLKEHLELDCLYKKTACQWCGVLISKAEQEVSCTGLKLEDPTVSSQINNEVCA